jgi:predicted amidohydrolase YtcJ
VTTTLYRGGRIYSAVDPFATALVVENDQIAWVGSDAAADTHADGVDEVVELDDAFVTPAFVDAHVHVTSTGLHLSGLDLSNTATLGDALELIEQHSRRVRGAVVLGHGWDETRWPEGRPPRRDELDRASYGGVVYLSRVDVHSCVASSALMALASDVGDAPGFSADGWLSQQAHHIVRRIALDSVTPAQRRAAQMVCLEHAASLGIGIVHELGGPEISSAEDFEDLLVSVGPASGLSVIGYWGEGGGPDVAVSLGATGAAGDHFVDGAIGSRTAYLRAPYADAPTRGAAYTTAADIRDHVIACSVAGVQAGYHVIGDGAMDMVVADAQSLLARLGVLASVQPVFDALWGGTSGMYADRLGADRARQLNPLASMQRAGIPLAFGSDAPVTPLAPWDAIRAATHHHQASERLTARAAFTAHTRGGWRAAGLDGGVIAAGQRADLAVWQCDELVVETPDDRVSAWSTDARAAVPGLPALSSGTADPECLRTIVGGRTVYPSDAVSPDNAGSTP